MNMKRGLVFALTALALVVGNSAAQAQNVQLSLNLRYTDPADPTEGGSWYLMAKTDATFGLAGVSVNLSGVNAAGVALGNPTANPQYATMASTVTGSIANGSNPYNGVIGGNHNVVWGFDVGTSVIANIGKGGASAGNIAVDPLKNAAWNNAALLVSGTFGAVRPAIVSAQANVLGAATAGTAAVAATVATPVVRGDSVISFGLNSPATAGLNRGDFNRDFAVNGLDLAVLAANFNGSGKNWDTGDSDDTGTVNGLDLANLAAKFNQSSPAPISAVPEPASMLLAGLAIGGVALARRRR